MALKTLSLAGLSSLFLTVGAMPALAVSGFAGFYAPGNFTFSSDPPEALNMGDLDIDNAATGEVTIFGPDDAFNMLGTTPASNSWSIMVTPAGAGTISFNWSFSSALDEVGDDTASYFINSNFFTLATGNGETQSSSSPVNLNLLAGDTFGFQVSTATNLGGEGILTINDFNATPVPFESDALPVLVSMTFLGAGMWAKRRFSMHK
ncbi:hypothetical protein IQ218_12965 [Synechocystis salina LEGE 06099]|uniref:hypothetical protein n=1 Tax=Synechocystis salina TaxID=945780 RepID=UPI00187ECA2A|nr:hypothetical protein [Synechocystis salina]MBE9204180.1 hypothetical protein [Synechocystis salina LEGE 06099]